MAARKRKRADVAAAPAPAGSPRVVAVTGAFGSLGRRVLRLLDADGDVDKVVAIDVRGSQSVAEGARNPVEFLAAHKKLSAHTLDLTEAGADRELAQIFLTERVGAVMHLAFLSSPTHALEMAHELETIGTLYALHAAGAARVSTWVSVSSTMCYGARSDNPAWITEAQPLRPPPSRSIRDKADADEQALRFADEHKDIHVAVARLGAVLGTAPDHFWTRTFARPVVPAVLGYDPLFQLMLADDAAQAVYAIFKARARGAYNVVSRGVLPLSHVLSRLGRVPLYLPPGLGGGIAHALWTAQLSDMPRQWLEYLRWPWVCDGEKLRRETGFVPVHDISTVLQIFGSGAWRAAA